MSGDIYTYCAYDYETTTAQADIKFTEILPSIKTKKGR